MFSVLTCRMLMERGEEFTLLGPPKMVIRVQYKDWNPNPV